MDIHYRKLKEEYNLLNVRYGLEEAKETNFLHLMEILRDPLSKIYLLDQIEFFSNYDLKFSLRKCGYKMAKTVMSLVPVLSTIHDKSDFMPTLHYLDLVGKYISKEISKDTLINYEKISFTGRFFMQEGWNSTLLNLRKAVYNLFDDDEVSGVTSMIENFYHAFYNLRIELSVLQYLFNKIFFKFLYKPSIADICVLQEIFQLKYETNMLVNQKIATDLPVKSINDDNNAEWIFKELYLYPILKC